MNLQSKTLRSALLTFAVLTAFSLSGCTKKSSAQTSTPADLQVAIKTPFRFVAYGDTRFHDPKDTEAANPPVRVALVKAITGAKPAFICFTGDIVYNGYDTDDWKVWDSETAVWREQKIPVYPALGNHDLHGKEETALGNYFQRFPDLKNSRYYSARAANTLVLVLDSSLEETTGQQGQWLTNKLDQVPRTWILFSSCCIIRPTPAHRTRKYSDADTGRDIQNKPWRRC